MALKNPILSNPIAVDITKLNEILDALTKVNPTDVDGISTGAMRLIEVSSGKWQWQVCNGSTWASVPFLQHNVDQLDGYHAAITPAANTVAVRNASGLLQDSITGNAATASSAATLSQTLPVNKGGTGATTSEAARANLGVPPTSHASTNTTHGVGNATQYGHLKLSDAANSSSGVSGGVAATPAAVKVAKDAADAAQSSADSAQSSADAAMTKASTLATASSVGLVKPGTGMTVDAAGALNVSLNNTVTSTSTTQSATANAVKTAYDKAVEANEKATILKLFNSRLVITNSNAAWTPPVTGWARVTVIGGGGGGAGGSGDSEAAVGGGGGGSGDSITDYVYLSGNAAVTIGAGGRGGAVGNVGTDGGKSKFTLGNKSFEAYGGKGGGLSLNLPYSLASSGKAGGIWGINGNPGNVDALGASGLGNVGGGGNGGGCAAGYAGYKSGFQHLTAYSATGYGSGGAGGSGGKDLAAVNRKPGSNGASGAVIIEYYDPDKEIA